MITAGFKITGTSTGVGWSWSIDNGAVSGQVAPVGPGGSAAQLAVQWAASVNAKGQDCPGAAGGSWSSSLMAIYFRGFFPKATEFCVGDYGTVPLPGDPNSCCMRVGSNDSCTFNPTVTGLVASETLLGTAQGGTVSADVDGQIVAIATSPGQSAHTVAQNLAEAIRSQTGFDAVATFGSVFVADLAAEDFQVTVNDAGLRVADVPSLAPWSGALALCALVVLSGVLVLLRQGGRWTR